MKDKEKQTTPPYMQSGSPIIHNSVPIRLLAACFFSCIVGVILMAVTAHYYLMAVFISIIICVFITTPLLKSGKITIETACLAPMLILCFVYTPVSWFTLGGLLGSTPYLSILFFTIITLTYYSRVQTLLLSLYALFMLGLIIHWMITRWGEFDTVRIINISAAYIISTTVTINVLEGIKKKNLEANKRIVDISMRDELTGLLNRRITGQIIEKLESAFLKDGTEYSAIIIDIDKFKAINDLYGHNSGDIVLKHLAECIQKSIRSTDYAFRFGGDEFLVLISNIDRAIAARTCIRIETALIEMKKYDFTVTVSTGYALRSECRTAAEILELADQSMYANKRS